MSFLFIRSSWGAFKVQFLILRRKFESKKRVHIIPPPLLIILIPMHPTPSQISLKWTKYEVKTSPSHCPSHREHKAFHYIQHLQTGLVCSTQLQPRDRQILNFLFNIYIGTWR